MRSLITVLALGAMIGVPTALLANRFLLRERIILPVRQIDADSFEVVEADGAGGAQIWCAAGLFSRNVLEHHGRNLTVLRPRGPSEVFPGRSSVIFSTRPAAEPKSSYSASVRTAGLTFSVTHANAICRSILPEQVVRVRIIT